MKLTLQDRSLYFKGLLLLIRKDRSIADSERSLMMRIGQSLSFEKAFCETAIDDILKNEHIIDVPPEFSDANIAKYFILDALILACSDGTLHTNEEAWLKSVCLKNGLSESWFTDAKRDASGHSIRDWNSVHLTVDTLTYI